MSTFKRYGGLNHLSSSMFIRGQVMNAVNLNMLAQSGLPNAIETFASTISMSQHSILDVDTVCFVDGSCMSTNPIVFWQSPDGINIEYNAGNVSTTHAIESNSLLTGTIESESLSTGTIESESLSTGTIQSESVSVSGAITCQTISTSSDYRLKHHIRPLTLDPLLYSIDRLHPVLYQFKQQAKEESKDNQTEKKDVNKEQQQQHDHDHMGLIAHEVQSVLPWLVKGEKDGPFFQTVNYVELIALLVKEIQVVKQRLHVLETEMETQGFCLDYADV